MMKKKEEKEVTKSSSFRNDPQLVFSIYDDWADLLVELINMRTWPYGCGSTWVEFVYASV